MVTKEIKQELEKQQYRVVGNHSVVKICGWTKKSIKDEGECYKNKFYGIRSHQCLQMSTCLSCANRCVFCWRGYKAPVSKKWKGEIDDPEFILKNSLKEQQELLNGFGGLKNINKKNYKDSQTVKHAALSLTGEPILYPKINELIKLFHKNGISTFMVTNAQYPEAIRDLEPVTQLYLSLDAPNKELLKKIDIPLFTDYWERLNQSLEYLSKRKERTCIRLSMIKNENMCNVREYAELIKKGNPDFVELKGYMFIGASRQVLKLENMPFHEEVVEFSKKLLEFLDDSEMVSEHILSRAVLLAKKKYFYKKKWHTWIDFDKFIKLANSKKDYQIEDYWLETPEVGISGKGTIERMKNKVIEDL